jgi:hypothetical protein
MDWFDATVEMCGKAERPGRSAVAVDTEALKGKTRRVDLGFEKADSPPFKNQPAWIGYRAFVGPCAIQESRLRWPSRQRCLPTHPLSIAPIANQVLVSILSMKDDE